jgi:hypothetical protein
MWEFNLLQLQLLQHLIVFDLRFNFPFFLAGKKIKTVFKTAPFVCLSFSLLLPFSPPTHLKSKKMTMRIAAVQFHIDHKDKEVNWKRAEEFMSKAANDNVDLIVFPE